MVKRTRKPPVKLEQRRDWLKRYEEENESPPQIAAKDGFDIRTVRKQIETAKEEREAHEARLIYLRDAVEKHYDDLRRIAEKLNSEITGFGKVPYSPDDDLIESALRQHLPRSPIWTYLVKRETLRKKADVDKEKLVGKMKEVVQSDNRLKSFTDRGLVGIVPGIIAVLEKEIEQWSQGYEKHTLKDSLMMEPAGEGFVNPRLGFSHMGPMKETEAEGNMKQVRDKVGEFESLLKNSKEFIKEQKDIVALNRIGNKLREELAVIRLRRIIPGRCKYCPL
jgi:hypothetical protein